ncbi:hypothetical protein [Phreatobacter oligotrophus]|uniref:Uncharacterized protein n=1 Tax=Phreatobacter oligotrophus TaxID=1122261 RepID=A0A2T4ZIU9_9HYPH|nr:hypothetical protein [Phreatobacter oligotrophus]PTM61884.1 hypothetical protein C8P69_101556 [Phreatobacter oligotrophus]
MTPRVTDHAVLQFLARVHGFDVDGCRQRIEEICAKAVRAGASGVTHEGHHFVIKGDAVITVLPRGARPEHGDRALIRRPERPRPISQLLADEMD